MRTEMPIGDCRCGRLGFWLAFTGAVLIHVAPAGAAAGEDGVDRARSVQSAVAKLVGQVQELESEVASLPKARDDAARLAEEKAAKQEELDRLAFKAESLNEAVPEPVGQPIAESLDALEQKGQELLKRLAELKRERLAREADLASVLEATASNRTFRADVGKIRWSRQRSRNIALIGDRVVPIEEPYYQFEWGQAKKNGRGIPYVKKATRVQDGETVEAALRDGGCVTKMLKECIKRAEYIKLFVCPDAIPAFRLVVRVAKQRNVDFFWVPYADKPLEGSASGTGSTPTM